MVTVFPSTSYTYFQVSSARIQYLLNLATAVYTQVLKVKRPKMGTQVCANSSPARCAIYSRDTAIRICSVPRLKFKKPFVKMPLWDKVMGLAEYFLPAVLILDFSKYGHILGGTLCWRPQAPAWHASPWEHSPSSSAPCAVPMRLPRIGKHINDKPRAKQRAVLGVFSSRSWSVYRDIRSTYPIWIVSPLVARAVPRGLVRARTTSD
jgi:hypothetical protein